MKRHSIILAVALVASLLGAALFFHNGAAQLLLYSLPAWAASAGGGTLSNGPYTLTGTVGQIEPNPAPAAASPYTLSGGFWGPVSTPASEPQKIYMPLLQK